MKDSIMAALPGPKGHVLFGNLDDLRKDFLGFLIHTARQYGDVSAFRAGPASMVLINHPDLVNEVLVKRADRFYKTGSTKRLLAKFLGEGLVSLEGEQHLQHRRLMQPAFHSQRIETYTQTMAQQAAQQLAGWRDGAQIDVHHEMVDLTLRIVAQTMFGVDVGAQTEQIGAAMTAYAESLNLRLREAIPLPEWIPTARNRQQRRIIDTLDAVVLAMIRQRRADGDDRADLLAMLLGAQDGAAQLDDKAVRDELMTIFFAGHETSANALTWIWALLAQHPQIEAKLHAELADILNGAAPTAGDLPRLPYLGMVIKEALRLYPPAWLFDREPVEDLELGGYTLKRGTTLFISPYVMHRDTRYFEQPEQFIPERFEQPMPKGAYLPFGAGGRVCIGQGFALTEISIVLATLATRVRFTLTEGQQVQPEPSATLTPRGGLPMGVNLS